MTLFHILLYMTAMWELLIKNYHFTCSFKKANPVVARQRETGRDSLEETCDVIHWRIFSIKWSICIQRMVKASAPFSPPGPYAQLLHGPEQDCTHCYCPTSPELNKLKEGLSLLAYSCLGVGSIDVIGNVVLSS